MKIFIDANVFVAACGSSVGGSAYLCTLDQKDFHIPAVRRWCKKHGMTFVIPRDLLVSGHKSHSALGV